MDTSNSQMRERVVFNPDNPLLAINGGDFLDYGKLGDLEPVPF